MQLSEGARQLPLRHISIRVPWHDTDWTGRVCKNPTANISCLILPRIRETREDEQEGRLAGQSWENLSQAQLPACAGERGGFMAPYERVKYTNHPYAKSNSVAHKRFQPTPYRYPPYSADCIPFGWMLLEDAQTKATALELGFQQELEDDARAVIGFNTAWVQMKHNQLVMLDTFFSAVQPRKSLCFFYAKRTPLVEDARRVIIGTGWVTHVGEPVEYLYSEPGPVDSVIWERGVQHSVRPGFKEGFLFPYHELEVHLQAHPEEDPARYVAFAPDEHFWSFSYAAEHVTNDGAISALLSCAKALENIRKVASGKWEHVQQWIDARLNELWKLRGPHPGLGAALTAFGIPNGALLSYELEQQISNSDNLDPWPLIDSLLRDPEKHPASLRRYTSATLSKKWASLPNERRALLQLLSRFELAPEQATRYYVHEDKQRAQLRIAVSDAELLVNPYLLYELDRVAPDPISLAIIDRGLFPDDTIRINHPLPTPSAVTDATDERRVRAFVVRQLESAAENGHTLRSREQVIRDIRELDVQPPCPVDGDMMNVVEPHFGPVVKLVSVAEDAPAYQLDRLQQMGQVIRQAIQRRLQGRRHIATVPWRQRLNVQFGGSVSADDEAETAARTEKTAVLEELFASRVSVLIGPAGTGKTTLLKVLCEEPLVATGGVLLLAPTGKARVRLESQTGQTGGKTIAQFLLPLDRYDYQTGAYRLSDHKPYQGAKTVIIDEASMLTEDQLAAVLDALSGVQRLVLVGDPRQLPPIGAGRPFLDIVNELEPEHIESQFPRVGQGYGELTVRRRQIGHARDDLLLADWFSGRSLDPGADEIWTKIEATTSSDQIQFIQWTSDEDLREKLLDLLVEDLGLTDRDDRVGFEISLGGQQWGDYVYFNRTYDASPGACAKVEDWQILSPVRNAPHGVEALNRLVHNTFRANAKQWAKSRYRKIPKPLGREEIIYGDKVICLKNERRTRVWPTEGALAYVANGEIGVAVGQYKGRKAQYASLPWKLEVEFASQPGYTYDYTAGDFAEESEPTLELAYALTVHKVQGSEFGRTYLVLPSPCRLISRELLYTALTRQRDKITIFHQGSRHEMKQYSLDIHSETARRLTNLFKAPQPIELENRFLEGGLIHRTERGEAVRSKSEVIVANILNHEGIDYQYEARLIGADGSWRYPDFSFEDDELGIQIYWEHLGMLSQPDYLERWEKKLSWYREQGVLPFEEGGGPNGTLVTSKDDERGGIQADEIRDLLIRVLS